VLKYMYPNTKLLSIEELTGPNRELFAREINQTIMEEYEKATD